ncbi:hypothetical protein HK405_010191 [Cladochytrium tenue]|nr:hypothetical protein HK405_010191 [Cladochytrium tenue]
MARHQCQVWAFVGVVGTVLVYVVRKHLATRPPPEPPRRHRRRGTDYLSLRALAELVKSPSVHLHDSAVQILLDRAISDRHFPQILYYCWEDDDADLKQKAVSTIQQLSKNEANRGVLVRWGVLKMLAHVLSSPNTETTYRNAVVTLYRLISNKEAEVQLKKLMNMNMPSIIAACLRNEDTELVSWAVFLLQEFVVKEFTRPAFCDVNGIVKNLLNLLVSPETCIPRVTLRALKCLGSRNEDFQHEILRAGVLKKAVPLIRSSDRETQFWALALLHDLLLSCAMIEKILARDGLKYLSDFIGSPRADIQILAAKALATMARKDAAVRPAIYSGIVGSLIAKVTKEASRLNFDEALGVDLEALCIFFLPNALGYNADPVFWGFEAQTADLYNVLLDALLLPFLGDSDEELEEESALSPESPAAQFAQLREALVEPFSTRLVELEHDESLMAEVAKKADGLDYALRELLAIRSLNVITALTSAEAVRTFIEAKSIPSLLLALVRSRSKPLAREALLCLAVCLHHGIRLQLSQEHIDIILKCTLFDGHPLSTFYGQLLLDLVADLTPKKSASLLDSAYVSADLNSVTPYLCLSKNKMEVRNDSWTFESVRATHGVTGSGKYAFEAHLNTDGIMQVGWTTTDIVFDSEGGEGVGDNEYSYAYDGHRTKKWHAYAVTDNTYGELWASGDVVTALLDLDEGTVSFLRNGNSLGVAFSNVNTSETWYPAVSLASAQGCRLVFGSALDPLAHLPAGYGCIEVKGAPATRVLPEEPSEPAYQVVTEGYGELVGPDEQRQAPAFYFEVTVGMRALGESSPLQVGLYDGAGRLYAVASPAAGDVLLFVAVQGAISSQQEVAALARRLEAAVTAGAGAGNFEDSEADSEAVAVAVVAATADNIALAEGDVLGAGVEEPGGRIVFTRNGAPLGK